MEDGNGMSYEHYCVNIDIIILKNDVSLFGSCIDY